MLQNRVLRRLDPGFSYSLGLSSYAANRPAIVFVGSQVIRNYSISAYKECIGNFCIARCAGPVTSISANVVDSLLVVYATRPGKKYRRLEQSVCT